MNIAPIQFGIVASFVSILFALAGILRKRPQWVRTGSAAAVILSGFSLLAYVAINSLDSDPMLPITTLCFFVVAGGFALAQTNWPLTGPRYWEDGLAAGGDRHRQRNQPAYGEGRWAGLE